MKTATIGGQLIEIIDFEARPHQRELMDIVLKRALTKDGPQFFVPVDHRRSGKSSSLVNILIAICSNPRKDLVGQYYYLYPLQDQVREHLWDNPGILPKFLPRSQVSKKDDQRMVIQFKSGSQLIFDGTDKNPNKHRGGDGKGYVLDELDDHPEELFRTIIRPVVEFNKGFAVLSGTPQGMLQLHDAYLAGQDETRPQWWSRLLPATESRNADGSRLITDEQLADIERDYKAEGKQGAFRQEYLVTFEQGENVVFRRVDEVINDIYGQQLEPKEPIDGRRYLIGTDPAITSDYWANSVLDLHTMEEVCLERFQPNSTELGVTRTEALSRKYNNAQIRLDSAGIGLPIYDMLISRRLSVEPLNTGVNKERLITNLQSIVDALSVRFLPDPIAMGEMRDFTFNRLRITGRYQFSAPEGKHDDTVIARALVCWELPQPLPLPDQPGVLTNMRKEYYSRVGDSYFQRNRTYFGKNIKT